MNYISIKLVKKEIILEREFVVSYRDSWILDWTDGIVVNVNLNDENHMIISGF